MVPATGPKPADRSLAMLLGPEALDLAVGTLNSDWRIDRVTPKCRMVLVQHQEIASADLASVVHPDDVDRVLSALRNTAENTEDTVVRVRLRHSTRGWTETRCLFFSLPQDESRNLGLVLAESARNLRSEPDAQPIATLEYHLLRFA